MRSDVVAASRTRQATSRRDSRQETHPIMPRSPVDFLGDISQRYLRNCD